MNKFTPSLPVLQGILPLNASLIPGDILAGITLAALAIPEVMGYTRIAGMPVVTGLYTLLIPLVVFALLGSSRHLVVGADSATAAIMAAGLSGLATTGSPEYVAYAGVLALLAGVLLMVARLVRLGFLADFLSHTVLIGFLTGVGIQVMIGGVAGMLGFPSGEYGSIQSLSRDIQQLGSTNIYSLGISIGVVVIILVAKRINRKIPGALIAVIGAILVSYFFNLAEHGVALLGAVPRGLPIFGLPQIALNMPMAGKLASIAFSMFIVILAQSAATSRAYATHYNEPFSENLDLVGLGLANIGAGLSGTFVVNGSPTKTQMVEGAGGRSQLAQVTTALVVLLVLAFLTGPLAYLPSAVLSTVVFLIGLELIDIKGMRRILFERPYEFWVALFTVIIVVILGVEQGILLAIFLSLIIHTRHGYKPKNTLLVADETGDLHLSPISSHAQAAPGLIIYRFHHSMYYANAQFMTQEILALVNSADPALTWFCVDATAVDDIDFTAAAALGEIHHLLLEKNVCLVLANVDDDVRSELDRSGLTGLLGNDAIFRSIPDVMRAYQRRVL